MSKMIDKSKIKVIAMDLDGTLTQHKQPMAPLTRETLVRLGQKYKLVMAGAGQVMRIFNQMERFPIDVIGNYGLQYATYNEQTGELDMKRNETLPQGDRESIEAKVTALREKHLDERADFFKRNKLFRRRLDAHGDAQIFFMYERSRYPVAVELEIFMRYSGGKFR